jgi:Tol biopolymer transport system component
MGLTASTGAAAQESPIGVELVGPGVISTEGNETFPAEDPVDASLWFSIYEDSFGAQTIVRSTRTASGWGEPKIAPFSGEWGDRAPRFSPDGSILYFTSNRPRPGATAPGAMNIWVVERSSDGWGDPTFVAAPVSTFASDIHAALTDTAVWLASNRAGGYGRSDIYRIGTDGTATHLPAPINDELSQPDLWVSRDESWMILVITDHPDGYGGDDLYLSRFDGASWSEPANLGPVINSAEYEYGPTVSADGTHLYFTSHRGGSADVYRIPVSAIIDRRE